MSMMTVITGKVVEKDRNFASRISHAHIAAFMCQSKQSAFKVTMMHDNLGLGAISFGWLSPLDRPVVITACRDKYLTFELE